MPPKRPLSSYGLPEEKKSKVDTTTRGDAVKRARERIAQLKANKAAKEQQQYSDSHSVSPQPISDQAKPKARGLNVELHPLLTGAATIADMSRPVDNPNLLKANKRGMKVNPYLQSVKPARAKRVFHFNEKGKYIKEGEEFRVKLQQKVQEEKTLEEKKQAGLLPDIGINEDKFIMRSPPDVEWWDLPLLKGNQYGEILDDDELLMYIQHPVPIHAPWEKHLPPLKPMFLTKKEHKRIRRIDRAEKQKELQDKIQLGLEPVPKPKIKLSNLMVALTNDAIKDPTAIEKRVLKEVAERKTNHEKDNKSRMLTKKQRHEKEHQKRQRDLEKGYQCAVFKIDKLVHPGHRFKVETNVKQLELTGTLLYGPRFVLCIVEGGEKSVNFYKKLMMKRIKWDESTNVGGNELNLDGNTCQLLWEGSLKETKFSRWSAFWANDDATAIDFLKKFGAEGYYIIANSKAIS